MNPTPAPISFSDIQVLLSELDASGQSAASFARALDRRTGRPRPQTAAKRPPQSMFVPAQVVDSASPSAPSSLELLLAGGHHSRIGADFDPEHLRRVVEALSRC